MTSVKYVGFVVGSTRTTRLGPFITKYLQEKMAPHCRSAQFSTVDLATFPLPLYDEPVMPGKQPAENPTPHYEHDFTRQWSAEVLKYDALVFVTPQYNWSVPAGLKNALDYLYHEWKGKPAGIVSYGGRGGDKAATHLRDILNGLRMQLLTAAPALSTSSTMLPYIAEHGAVSDEDKARWEASGANLKVENLAQELAQKLSLV